MKVEKKKMYVFKSTITIEAKDEQEARQKLDDIAQKIIKIALVDINFRDYILIKKNDNNKQNQGVR